MVSIKSKYDIDKMLEAGKIAAEALNTVEAKLRPGMTTKDIDNLVYLVITSHGATPNFLGLYGFPASACVSVNEEVIHGIPGNRRLNDGDIVSVDLGACYKGWNSDTCFTFPVGKVKPDVQALLEATNASLYEAIAAAQVGARLGDISHTVEDYCRSRGYGIVQNYCGHGIGTEFFSRLGQWAKKEGIVRLELTVQCRNTAAVRLYEKCGFQIEGTKVKSMVVDGEFVDEYYMAKVMDYSAI